MNMLTVVEFAITAHAKQRRKYTDEAYIVHPMAVARMIASRGYPDQMIAAAWLHDTVEDCGIKLVEIESRFGNEVMRMVSDLTHIYTKEDYPNMNRAERKHYESLRMARISTDSKTIKLADLIDNTQTIVQHDPEFAATYLEEKRHLLSGPLVDGDKELWSIAMAQVIASLKQIHA